MNLFYLFALSLSISTFAGKKGGLKQRHAPRSEQQQDAYVRILTELEQAELTKRNEETEPENIKAKFYETVTKVEETLTKAEGDLRRELKDADKSLQDAEKTYNKLLDILAEHRQNNKQDKIAGLDQACQRHQNAVGLCAKLKTQHANVISELEKFNKDDHVKNARNLIAQQEAKVKKHNAMLDDLKARQEKEETQIWNNLIDIVVEFAPGCELQVQYGIGTLQAYLDLQNQTTVSKLPNIKPAVTKDEKENIALLRTRYNNAVALYFQNTRQSITDESCIVIQLWKCSLVCMILNKHIHSIGSEQLMGAVTKYAAVSYKTDVARQLQEEGAQELKYVRGMNTAIQKYQKTCASKYKLLSGKDIQNQILNINKHIRNMTSQEVDNLHFMFKSWANL